MYNCTHCFRMLPTHVWGRQAPLRSYWNIIWQPGGSPQKRGGVGVGGGQVGAHRKWSWLQGLAGWEPRSVHLKSEDENVPPSVSSKLFLASLGLCKYQHTKWKICSHWLQCTLPSFIPSPCPNLSKNGARKDTVSGHWRERLDKFWSKYKITFKR